MAHILQPDLAMLCKNIKKDYFTKFKIISPIKLMLVILISLT